MGRGVRLMGGLRVEGEWLHSFLPGSGLRLSVSVGHGGMSRSEDSVFKEGFPRFGKGHEIVTSFDSEDLIFRHVRGEQFMRPLVAIIRSVSQIDGWGLKSFSLDVFEDLPNLLLPVFPGIRIPGLPLLEASGCFHRVQDP